VRRSRSRSLARTKSFASRSRTRPLPLRAAASRTRQCFVDSSSTSYNWGLFTQTFFSFPGKNGAPDVGIVNIQPIFTYKVGGGRSLSLGNSALTYDTERSRWTSLLASVNYGQVVSFWGNKWRPNVEAAYDFQNDFGNQKWVIRLGIQLLVPAP
jgi:hypothetical protein